nr:hypothetical protein [uncultured Flavobacterium sp.]
MKPHTTLELQILVSGIIKMALREGRINELHDIEFSVVNKLLNFDKGFDDFEITIWWDKYWLEDVGFSSADSDKDSNRTYETSIWNPTDGMDDLISKLDNMLGEIIIPNFVR